MLGQQQSWQWARIYGGPSMDKGNSLTVDEDGYTYLTGAYNTSAYFGSIHFTNSSGNYTFLAKIDSLGIIIWVKSFCLSAQFGQQVVLGKNRLYISGIISDTVRFGNIKVGIPGGPSTYLISLNKNGSVISGKTISSSTGSIISANNKDEIIVSSSFKDSILIDAVKFTGTNAYNNQIALFDSIGNLVWTRTFGSSQQVSSSAIKMVDKSLCLTGEFINSVTFNTNTVNSTNTKGVYIATYDIAGNFKWASAFSSSSYLYGSDIEFDKNKNIFVCGQFNHSAEFNGTIINDTGSPGNGDAYVTKYDSLGAFQWVRSGGGGGTDDASRIGIDSLNNVYISGGFFVLFTCGSININANPNNVTADIYILKLDNNGNPIWGTRATTVNNPWNFLSDMTIGNNSLYMTGYSSAMPNDTIFFGSHPTFTIGSDDIFIAKTNSLVSPTGIEEINKQVDNKIFPNPINNGCFLSFSDFIDLKSYEILDITGRVMDKKDFTNLRSIYISNFPSGSYILKTLSFKDTSTFYRIIVN